MLVASTNPCPCGFAGSDRCRCSDADVARYRRRLSGPLLDRLDLLVSVHRPTAGELHGDAVTTSAAERERVEAARQRQAARLQGSGATCNAHMGSALVRRHIPLDGPSTSVLRRFYDRGWLSPRGHHRALRVARTIADLEGEPHVNKQHVLEALTLRQDADAGSEREAA
jgi:magnesium chelatase family protein